jgi:rubrerythrin
MNKDISINDIFKAAMQVEAIGEAFYRKYAEISDSPEIKKTFDFLAGREKTHYQKFQDWLSVLNPGELDKGISQDNRPYLSKTINQSIFSEERKPENLLKKVKTMRDALQTALELENGSIEYYEKMKQEVSPEVGKEIGKIISEEQTHAQTITGMLDNIP